MSVPGFLHERWQGSATLLRRVLALFLAFSALNAESGECDHPRAAIHPEVSEALVRSGTQIHPSNALKVIRELAPDTPHRPRFSERGEFDVARRFFQALSLDFEQAGILFLRRLRCF